MGPRWRETAHEVQESLAHYHRHYTGLVYTRHYTGLVHLVSNDDTTTNV